MWALLVWGEGHCYTPGGGSGDGGGGRALVLAQDAFQASLHGLAQLFLQLLLLGHGQFGLVIPHHLVNVGGALRAVQHQCPLLQHPRLGSAPHEAQLQGPGALGVLPRSVGGHERPLVKAYLGVIVSGAVAQQDGLGAHGGCRVDIQVPSPGHIDCEDHLDVLQVSDKVFLPLTCVGRECQHQLVSGQNFPEGRVASRHSEGWGHYPRVFCFFVFCFFNFWLHPGACGTLVPPPRIELMPPTLEVRVLITGLLGDSYPRGFESHSGEWGEHGLWGLLLYQLCDPEQVTCSLWSVWTGDAANTDDPLPTSPRSLLGFLAPEAPVDPDGRMSGTWSGRKNPNQWLTGRGESILPAFLTAGGDNSVSPVGLSLLPRAARCQSAHPLCLLYWVALSPCLHRLLLTSVSWDNLSEKTVSTQVPLGQLRMEQELRCLSFTAFSTLIKRNYCWNDCCGYRNNMTAAQKWLVMATPDRYAVEHTVALYWASAIQVNC